MRPIVVFDTNVLLSGIGWRGTPYRCLELARRGTVEGITCPEILDELAEKLRGKLGIPDDHVSDTIADLLGFLRVVSISGGLRVVSSDPDDDKIVECAVAGGARLIVTGDRRHLLPMVRYEGVEIISAADLLVRYGQT